jgi:hypothetical protein
MITSVQEVIKMINVILLHVGAGIFVSTATVIDPSSPVAAGVYVVAALALVTFAIVSLFTGFKIDFAPFKLCPFIFSTSALIILIGAFG